MKRGHEGDLPAPVTVLERAAPRRLPWWVSLWVTLVLTKPLGAVGLVVMVAFVVVGAFAPWIAPEDYRLSYSDRLIVETGLMGPGVEYQRIPGPSLAHPFGLDNIGRDVLSLIIHGARISVTVGLGAVLLGVGGGAVVGVLSAWWAGRVDTGIQRVVDAWLTFPYLVVLITFVTVFPKQSPIPFLTTEAWALARVVLALGILNVAWYSRIVRSAAMVIKEAQYIEASKALGASGRRIVLHHMVPNVMAPIITLATLGIGGAILWEASLSFLGYGVPPPNPSWGGMLTANGLIHYYRAPWLAFFPGVAITLVVMGANFLGDALRDLLDPRLRGTT